MAPATLTAAHVAAYLAERGQCCPRCGTKSHENVDHSNLRIDLLAHTVEMVEDLSCRPCGFNGVRIFRLHRVEEVVDGHALGDIPPRRPARGVAFDEPDSLTEGGQPEHVEPLLSAVFGNLPRNERDTVYDLLDGIESLGVNTRDLRATAAGPLDAEAAAAALERCRIAGFHTYDSDDYSEVYPPWAVDTEKAGIEDAKERAARKAVRK